MKVNLGQIIVDKSNLCIFTVLSNDGCKTSFQSMSNDDQFYPLQKFTISNDKYNITHSADMLGYSGIKFDERISTGLHLRRLLNNKNKIQQEIEDAKDKLTETNNEIVKTVLKLKELK